MLKEPGKVVAVEGDSLLVECISKSACSSCEARHSCGSGTISKAFPAKSRLLKVPNIGNHQPGQAVVVEIPEANLMKAALVMYVLPLAFLLLGALIAELLIVPLIEGSELITIVCSLGGMLLGLLVAKKLSVRLERDTLYQPNVTVEDKEVNIFLHRKSAKDSDMVPN